MKAEEFAISRHRFLSGVGVLGVGGAVAAASACSTSGETTTATTPTAENSASADPPSPPSASAAEVLAPTADVPVGSGIIVADTVLTQPVSGEFLGFTTVCTHSGCTLNAVADGTINCPCHGSKFNLDGTVAHGPAAKPLPSKPIVVQGDSILAG